VSSTLAWVVLVLCLVVTLYAGYLILRDRPVDDTLFYGAAALEVLLVAQAIGGCVALTTTERDVDGVTFVGYLLTAVIAPPVGVLWGISEKSRWGTGVVIIAMVTVAALQLRIAELWAGA
jgi:hypothetical protein